MPKPTVGFIGLGIMGLAMARNAQKAGFPIVAYNRGKERAAQGQQANFKMVNSPDEVIKNSDWIVIMVTGPESVKEVMAAENGILSTAGDNKILLQMSTIDVNTTLEMAEKAHEKKYKFVDCPVAGSKAQVEAAQLIILAGGDPQIISVVKPFLLSIGKAVVEPGEIGKGTGLKLCMNLIVAQMTSALAESTALADALKVKPEKIFEVLSHSPALNCGYYEIKKKNLLSNNYAPAFSLSNMLKDVRFMVDEGNKRGLNLPVTTAVKSLMEKGAGKGLSEKDLMAIRLLLEQNSSVGV